MKIPFPRRRPQGVTVDELRKIEAEWWAELEQQRDECPCCVIGDVTIRQSAQTWRCVCGSRGVLLDGRMAVTRAAAGTFYFDPVRGPAFRAQIRAELDKERRERGS